MKNDFNVKPINLKNSNNNLNMQNYFKKKINQICYFNQNHSYGKNNKKNLSRNLNYINNNYNTQNFKFKNSSELNNINSYNF